MGRIRNLSHSLWFKIAGTFVLILLTLLPILVLIVTSVTQRAFRNYVAGRSAFIQNRVPTLVAPPVPPTPTRPPRPTTPPRPTVVLDANAPAVTAVPAATAVPPATAVPAVRVVAEDTTGTIEIVKMVEPEPLVSEIVGVAIPSQTEAIAYQFLQDVQRGLLWAVTAAFATALMIGTFLTWRITRPLTQLRWATQALASGDLTARVSVKSKDEVSKVADSFNQMAAQLEKQEQIRRQMVADVAHELRTPLTVMKSNLEAMQDGLLQPDTQELGELYTEVERLSRMIEDLRLLSLADAGQLSLQVEEVDVSELIAAVITRHRSLAQTQSVQLLYDLGPVPFALNGDSDKLQQALDNLVNNALRHTPPGGQVSVKAVKEKNTVHLSVSDTGAGILPEDSDHVFDRFWRGDKSRSRDSGGSGLGLSIVRQIVELHGGTVRVASSIQGTIFTISLPSSS